MPIDPTMPDPAPNVGEDAGAVSERALNAKTSDPSADEEFGAGAADAFSSGKPEGATNADLEGYRTGDVDVADTTSSGTTAPSS